MIKNGKQGWRICDNPRCNEMNDEPEKVVVPYTILGESKRGNAYLAERNGWHGKDHQQYIPKVDFFDSREAAEDVLRAQYAAKSSICPKCHSTAAYDPYFKKHICRQCGHEMSR